MTKPIRPKRLRRCQLSVPGSSEKMIAKAAGLGVDYIFFDLEDAVAPAQKKEARRNIVSALNTLDFGRSVRCVRINDTATRFCYGDIIEVVEGAGSKLDLIMISKVLDADDVLFVDKLLSQLEKDLELPNRIGLECLIEEVEGMMNIEHIAASTPRLEALIFGMGDYSASQGISVKALAGSSGYPGDIWHYQRQRLAIACKAYGLDPVDGPFADIKNPEAYREMSPSDDARPGRKMGHSPLTDRNRSGGFLAVENRSRSREGNEGRLRRGNKKRPRRHHVRRQNDRYRVDSYRQQYH